MIQNFFHDTMMELAIFFSLAMGAFAFIAMVIGLIVHSAHAKSKEEGHATLKAKAGNVAGKMAWNIITRAIKNRSK
jgi:hypothetical protein